ncbi:MAG: preprotein translocase subunit YajC [Dehalococcoidia bacterium]
MDWLLSAGPMILLLVAFFAVMYFLMIRPRQKQQREQEEMTKELRSGDRVITAGGIYGRIEGVDEETVLLKIESGATMRVARASVIGKQGTTDGSAGAF